MPVSVADERRIEWRVEIVSLRSFKWNESDQRLTRERAKPTTKTTAAACQRRRATSRRAGIARRSCQTGTNKCLRQNFRWPAAIQKWGDHPQQKTLRSVRVLSTDKILVRAAKFRQILPTFASRWWPRSGSTSLPDPCPGFKRVLTGPAQCHVSKEFRQTCHEFPSPTSGRRRWTERRHSERRAATRAATLTSMTSTLTSDHLSNVRQIVRPRFSRCNRRQLSRRRRARHPITTVTTSFTITDVQIRFTERPASANRSTRTRWSRRPRSSRTRWSGNPWGRQSIDCAKRFSALLSALKSWNVVSFRCFLKNYWAPGPNFCSSAKLLLSAQISWHFLGNNFPIHHSFILARL